MTQDVSNQTNTNTISPRSSSIPIQPWSLTTKADELMEEVFAELDIILEHGSNLSNQTTPSPIKTPESLSVESALNSQVPPQNYHQDSPLAVVDAQETGEIKVSELTTKYKSSELLTHPFERIDDEEGSYLDKMLFILALGCLVSVIWWLVEQDKLQLAFLESLMGHQPTTTEEIKISESDAQFIEYMQRSLDVMESRIAQRQEQQQVATAPLPVPPNPYSVSNPLPATILQPIYIPFSPQGQIPSRNINPPTAPYTPPAPSAPSAPPAPLTQAPAPTPPPIQTTVPTPPPRASIKKAPSSPIPPPAILPPPIPQVDHTLTGLLEDGEKSAALFDVNGTTQRIRLGEPIGASGWILVEVVDQKAIIRRNGEVRAIYAGQKF